jgi:hypothetical protein
MTTLTSRASAGLVAAVAGFASYQHIYRVATRAGEHRSVSAVLPLAIDGLILVATLAMLDDKRNRRTPRLSARVALVFGILATLAANVASAQPTVTARMVAAVPAVSFLLAVEVLARTGRPARGVTPAAVVTSIEPAGDPKPVDEPAAPDPGPVAPTRQDPDRPADVKVKPRRTQKSPSAKAVERVALKKPNATVVEIAAAAGVSESTARRYLPAVTVASASEPPPAETAPEPAVNGHHFEPAGTAAGN